MPNKAKLIINNVTKPGKNILCKDSVSKNMYRKKYSLHIILKLKNSFLEFKNKMQQKLIQTADRRNGSSYMC